MDAFPVHQFSLTAKGWREKLVDINNNDNDKDALRINKIDKGTDGIVDDNNKSGDQNRDKSDINAFSKTDNARDSSNDDISSCDEDSTDDDSKSYHFRMVLSPSPTPAVKSLIRNNNNNIGSNNTTSTISNNTTSTTNNNTILPSMGEAVVGDGLEISPLAIATCEDVAMRIVKTGRKDDVDSDDDDGSDDDDNDDVDDEIVDGSHGKGR